MVDALEAIVTDMCDALTEQQRAEFVQWAQTGQRHAVVEAILRSSFKMSDGGAEIRRRIWAGFTAKPSRT
jgi:hypothetical protein